MENINIIVVPNWDKLEKEDLTIATVISTNGVNLLFFNLMEWSILVNQICDNIYES